MRSFLTDRTFGRNFRPHTNTIVEDPVIAKTVQRRTISRYQVKVHLGGISFGPKNLCRNDELPVYFVELASLATESPLALPVVKFRRSNEEEASRLKKLTWVELLERLKRGNWIPVECTKRCLLTSRDTAFSDARRAERENMTEVIELSSQAAAVNETARPQFFIIFHRPIMNLSHTSNKTWKRGCREK